MEEGEEDVMHFYSRLLRRGSEVKHSSTEWQVAVNYLRGWLFFSLCENTDGSLQWIDLFRCTKSKLHNARCLSAYLWSLESYAGIWGQLANLWHLPLCNMKVLHKLCSSPGENSEHVGDEQQRQPLPEQAWEWIWLQRWVCAMTSMPLRYLCL